MERNVGFGLSGIDESTPLGFDPSMRCIICGVLGARMTPKFSEAPFRH